MNSIQFFNCSPEQFQIALQATVKSELELFFKKFKHNQPEDLLTRAEVAKMFRIDLSTLHNWCKAGKLKPHAIGRRIYFLRSELETSLTPLF